MALNLDYATYYDKVLGGWYGKFIGGTIGGPVEGVKDTLSLTYYQELPEISAPNDDADFQVVWLSALEEHGPWLTGEHLAQKWLDHIWYPFCEYGYGMKNFERRIYPPYSGWFNNEYFQECMGCPIRSEIWAFVCPGAPALAREYARQDATLDHAGLSVEAEQLLATMEAQAFVENDIDAILDVAMDWLPDESPLRECIEETYEWYDDEGDWRAVRMRILSEYGSPDMTSAAQNIAFTLLAFLEGGDDFGKVILTAANCGYDTDCTCATAGALMGILRGASAIPDRWKAPLQDRFSVGIDYQRPTNRISDLAADTCAMGALIAEARDTGVRILDAPRKAELRGGRPPSVRMVVGYPDGPGLAPVAPVRVQIAVANFTHRDLHADVRLTLPRHLREFTRNTTIRAEGMDMGVRDFLIACRDPARPVPLTNICKAEVVVDGEVVDAQEFGLGGPWLWRVFGPFWDSKGTFTNSVDFDREYLPEAGIHPDLPLRGEGIPDHRQFIFPTAVDRFATSDLFNCKGPLVAYLLQYIQCPSKRDVWFMVGNSGSFKLWLNDALEMQDDTRHPYMPFDNARTVALKRGTNKVLVKLVRYGDEMEFSFGVRNVERSGWHSSRWTTDLSVVPPLDEKGLK